MASLLQEASGDLVVHHTEVVTLPMLVFIVTVGKVNLIEESEESEESHIDESCFLRQKRETILEPIIVPDPNNTEKNGGS